MVNLQANSTKYFTLKTLDFSKAKEITKTYECMGISSLKQPYKMGRSNSQPEMKPVSGFYQITCTYLLFYPNITSWVYADEGSQLKGPQQNIITQLRNDIRAYAAQTTHFSEFTPKCAQLNQTGYPKKDQQLNEIESAHLQKKQENAYKNMFMRTQNIMPNLKPNCKR